MDTYAKLRLLITVLALAVLATMILASQPGHAAGPWYVAPGGNNSNDCLSPTTACGTISGALTKVGFTSGDTIRVATGTYTETFVLDKDATLSGGWDTSFATQSGNSIVEGQGQCHVVTVNDGVVAAIERFTIQNGACASQNSVMYAAGGGIYNDGTLTLTNSIVRNNRASFYGGGIYNVGTLTLTDSMVSGNTNTATYGAGGGGGGIYNRYYCTLTLNASTVSENTCNPNAPSFPSCSGGGIYNAQGTLTLNNSRVSYNTAQVGGGIISSGDLILNNSTVNGNTAHEGGGIRSDSTAHINNSTISGNTANYGGGIENNSYMTLNSCTISGNAAGTGGGIMGTSPTLQNTILADNTAQDCWGNVGSDGYNLVGNTSGCTFAASTGDLLNVNPRLFPLIGSPGYHPLLRGSPAIDAGNPISCTDHLGNALTSDQRGVARVGRCDIGAYEFDPNNDPLTYVFLPVIVRNR